MISESKEEKFSMAKKTMPVLQAGEPLLREIARPVNNIDKNLHRLLRAMTNTMYENEGVGLAAPQVGVALRVVVIDVSGELFQMINPVITKREGSCVSTEGCLSVPDFDGEVERAAEVDCEYTDANGKRISLHARELLAVCIQHELDHLDGVLFIDRARAIIPKEKDKEK